jgi:DNA (cytosine-5)-methyltransferase 1
MVAYYNEIDPFAAAWLRELIKAGHIAPGVVDERSIEDVSADDLVGFSQVHFFAGIGGWSLAARLAGWPDDRPLWTGSCPCQPFSTAGQRRGADDERHLWPVMRRLVDERRPSIVVGEQVASGLGRDWLSAVRSDLEELGYAVGAADLCAAGVGAPHVRQRLYWGAVGMADTRSTRCVSVGKDDDGRAEMEQECDREHGPHLARCSKTGGLGNTDGSRLQVSQLATMGGAGRWNARRATQQPGGASRMLDGGGWASAAHRGWANADWLYCRDAKWRPVEPNTFPLAHGIPSRVGRLRGYGNAIVPQVAAVFLKSLYEASGR